MMWRYLLSEVHIYPATGLGGRGAGSSREAEAMGKG